MLPRAGLRRRLLALNAATAATTGAPSLLPSRYLSPCLLLHPRRRQLSTKDDDDRGESRVRELLKQVQLGQLPVEAAVRAITAAAAQQVGAYALRSMAGSGMGEDDRSTAVGKSIPL